MSPVLPELPSFRGLNSTCYMNTPDFSVLATDNNKKFNLAWATHNTSVTYISSLCCLLATSAFRWTSEPFKYLKGMGTDLQFLCVAQSQWVEVTRKEILAQLEEELHPQSCQKQKELLGEVGSSLSLEVFEQMLENCLAMTSKVSPTLGISENYHADYCRWDGLLKGDPVGGEGKADAMHLNC